MAEPRIILPAEAWQMAKAATAGPWWTDIDPQPHPRWIHTAEPINIDEADWGPEGHTMYRLATNADDRAWRYGDVILMAAAPDLAYTAAVRGEQRDAALALHEQRGRGGKMSAWCKTCTDPNGFALPYPCPTARALGVES